VEGEAPAHWPGLVQTALDREASALTSLWQSRSPTQANAGDADRLAQRLEPVLARATREVIERLYPGAWPGADAA
jgi:hypothetical protein